MRSNINTRRGWTSSEVLLVFASFVAAVFVFLELGQRVLAMFFSEGNHYLAIPLF